ncbi:TPA: hypothetical protein ACF3XS_002967 [Vibrio parahaemolyticus]
MKGMRETIYSNGWKQGSVIEFQAIKDLEAKEGFVSPLVSLPKDKVKKPGSALLVAINMSCDVVFGKPDQLPHVKFLLCQPNKGGKVNSELGDPRQFVLDIGGESYLFRMKDRVFVPVELLQHLAPKDQLSEDSLNSLIRWKVAQFNRLGLPESLASRVMDIFNAPELDNWFGQNSQYLEGIFIEVNPRGEELPETEKYQIGVVAVVKSKEAKGTKLIDIQEDLDKLIIERLKGVNNLHVLNDTEEYQDQYIETAMSSSDFTYDMLKVFRRYYLDHYSLDPEDNTAPVGV